LVCDRTLSVSLCGHDYKSVRVAVMICVILVNTLTHTDTDTQTRTHRQLLTGYTISSARRSERQTAGALEYKCKQITVVFTG